jgi:uncharacterized damage-inducible protein DinB
VSASKPVSEGLLDPLRHNAWATRQLISFCRDLSPEQLQATSAGTYGSIIATLQHVIGAEGRYRSRLTGARPDWPREPEETEDLEELGTMAHQMARFWEEFAASDFDPDGVVSWVSPVSGAYTEVPAGVLVAQTLNHGNEHRSQISTILTTIGVEPPHLDGWSYALATGRFRETAPPS